MPKTTIAISIVICLIYGGTVCAAGPSFEEKRVPHRFTVHDSNHDGVLDRYEYQKFVEHRGRHRQQTTDDRPRHGWRMLEFSEIDQDGDGYITEDEMVQVLNRRLRKQHRYRARERRWSSQ